MENQNFYESVEAEHLAEAYQTSIQNHKSADILFLLVVLSGFFKL